MTLEHLWVRHLFENPIQNYLKYLLQCQRNRWLQLRQNIGRVLVQEQIHIIAQSPIAIEQIREVYSELFCIEVQFEFVSLDVLAAVFNESLRRQAKIQITVSQGDLRLANALNGKHKHATVDRVVAAQSDQRYARHHQQVRLTRADVETAAEITPNINIIQKPTKCQTSHSLDFDDVTFADAN